MNDFNIKKFLVENKMTRNSRLLKENIDASQNIHSINAVGHAGSTRYDQTIYVAVDSPEEAEKLAKTELERMYDKYEISDTKTISTYSDLDPDEQDSFKGNIAIFDADVLRGEDLNEESTYQFSEYDFDIKKNPEFYSKVVEIVKNNSDMTDEEIDAKIEAATDYHYSEARKANKNSREYPSMTAEEFAQSVMS